MTGTEPYGLVLFDGSCNLCDASVRWIHARDREAYFRFAPLDSDAARSALARFGGDADACASGAGSVVLIDRHGIHERSDAALRIAARLAPPYRLLALLTIVPRPLRDAVYDLVARNRYRFFGRRDACSLPPADLASRFIAEPATADRAGTGTRCDYP